MKKFFVNILWVVVCSNLYLARLDAQEDKLSAEVGYNKIVQCVRQKQWDQGITVANEVIRLYEREAKENFGPVFGHFYYLRGLLQLGKGEFAEASKSFSICYQKYRNPPPGSVVEEGEVVRTNDFWNASLFQWANCLMAQERFGEAAERYSKVAADPKVNPILVKVNRGRCLVKSGRTKEGFDLISPAMSEQSTASKGLKQTVFMILAEDWSIEMKETLPIRAFLDDYRQVVSLDTAEARLKRNPSFQALAQTEGIEKDDPARALLWYSLMVDPTIKLPAIDREIAVLEQRQVSAEQQARKQQLIGDKKRARVKVIQESWELLNGAGTAYFQMQNYSASFAVYGKLSDEVSKTYGQRPVFLHNTVTSAARIGKWQDAYKYGKVFLEDYPSHELMPAVARVLVEVIFLRNQYQESYTISGDIRELMELGSDERDIPDFVYGASAFHLRKPDEAEIELKQYLDNYPDGQRREIVSFFLGVTKVSLFKWSEAADLLNEFLASYPKSEVVPEALYQCALAEFVLDRNSRSLAKLNRLVQKYPSHPIIARAWNLKGDVSATEERDYEEVVAAYQKGRDTAYKLDDSETAAYSIWQLLIQSSGIEDWEEAQVNIDAFEARHSSSSYKLDVLVASLPTFVETERKTEGLDRLRAVVQQYGEEPTSTELSEMFGSYLDYLKSNFELEEVKAELNREVDNSFNIPALKGWYLVGLIDVTEQSTESDEEVNKVYYRLSSDFDPREQSNFVIVQLARWTKEFRKDLATAQNYYDLIIEDRPGTANYNFALLDTALILSESVDPNKRAEAVERFDRVLREVPEEELLELATLGKARMFSVDKDYESAFGFWEQYLNNREWTVSRAEANYEYGHCMDQLGRTQDAIKVYVSVYANFPGYLDWSTKAYIRTAEIVKDTGDDLKALLVLRDMLQRMGHHDHKGVIKGRQMFEKWRSTYKPEPKQAK